MPQWLVIGISGVTCGGKTTLSHALRDYFQSQRGVPHLWATPYTIGDVQLISQDDYFLPVDDLRHKWNDKLNAINFELLTSLDMKQLLSDIAWTMKGRYLATDPMEQIEYINEMCMTTNFEHYAAPPPPPPATTAAAVALQHHYQQHYYGGNHTPPPAPPPQHQYAHHQQHQQYQHLQLQQQQQPHHMLPHQRHMHTTTQQHIMRVNSQLAAQLRDNKVNVLIIEGFMIFNQPELVTLCNIKFHVHLPYEKCFERRRKRTYDPPDVTGYFEVCVWPHYEKNFAAFRDRKDITFLNGELSKERIFKFVLQKIVNYFEERCDVACPPPHKILGIPSYSGTSTTTNASGIPQTCPMEQQ